MRKQLHPRVQKAFKSTSRRSILSQFCITFCKGQILSFAENPQQSPLQHPSQEFPIPNLGKKMRSSSTKSTTLHQAPAISTGLEARSPARERAGEKLLKEAGTLEAKASADIPSWAFQDLQMTESCKDGQRRHGGRVGAGLLLEAQVGFCNPTGRRCYKLSSHQPLP